MKKVVFFLNYSKKDYFGGITNIVSNYMFNRDFFLHYGFDVNFLNPEVSFSKFKIISAFIRLSLFKKEKRSINKYLSNNKDVFAFHIHSSRGWIFNNDLKIAKYLKNKFGIKVFLSIHYAGLNQILSQNSNTKLKQLDILKKYVDRIIVLSKGTRDELIDAGISYKKISVLYTFHSFKSLNNEINTLDSDVLRLLFVGSLDRRKGILDLLSALKDANFRFVLNICGGFTDNSVKKEIEEYVFNDSRIIFNGYLTGKDKEHIFDQSDVLVLPSYGEGMPIVIMEALCFGCAIISTNVGAIPEIIKQDNGILLNPGDIDGIRESIEYLYNNRSVLDRIKASNLKLGKTFSLEENIKNMCRIYEDCTND